MRGPFGVGCHTVPLQPAQHVLAWAQHPGCLPELPRVIGAPGENIAGAMGTPAGDTGVAATQIRFSTVKTMSPRQKIDLWTDSEIIMHRHVKRHIQSTDQCS